MDTSDCIIDGLFLGGVLSALNEKDLSNKKITHILSIDDNPLPTTLTKKYVYKHVHALDMSEIDLLSFFPETFVFIEQARNGGNNVLVHCQAGMSRSATIVCAYLMQKMSMSKDKALDMMIARRTSVSPNDGFAEQLDLFEAMGCEFVKTHPLYRAFQLQKLANRFHGGYSAGDPHDVEVLSDLLLDTDFSTASNDAYYKCRKCRLMLFRHGAVTSHMTGKGERAFDWRGAGPFKHRHQEGSEDETDFCQRSLFVDPLLWMKGKINETSGKLHCPKCDSKIGSFVWYGEKCPCGTWVAPAFHIDTGKVDKIPFQTVAPSSRIVRPLTNQATAVVRGVTPVAAATSSSAPENIWAHNQSQTMGASTSFPPSSRSLSGRHTASSDVIPAPVVAAVAPLVSTPTSTSPYRVDDEHMMISERNTPNDHLPSTSSRPRVVGRAIPVSNINLNTNTNAGVATPQGSNNPPGTSS